MRTRGGRGSGQWWTAGGLAAALAVLFRVALTYRDDGPIPTDAGQLRSLSITNDWTGLGTPRQVRYQLEPAGANFTGLATYAEPDDASPAAAPKWSATHELAVPIESVERFLFVLSMSPLKRGTYTPYLDAPDDHPVRRIELETETGRLTVHSESQGEGAAPWGAEIGGKTYVIEADTPMRALNVLAPHLARP